MTFGHRSTLCAAVCIAVQTATADPPNRTLEDFQFVDDLAGFSGGTGSYTNPGTGGVGGDDDGYVIISSPFESHFGIADFGGAFSGETVDYVQSGITGIDFWLNDVGDADDFEIHLSLGTAFQNVWTFTQGFSPANNTWTQFSVDLTDPSLWTQTHGVEFKSDFEDALRHVTRIVIRHDRAPFVMTPDLASGDLGIDRIELVPEPTMIAWVSWAVFGWALRRRPSDCLVLLRSGR